MNYTYCLQNGLFKMLVLMVSFHMGIWRIGMFLLNKIVRPDTASV